jgi:amino acid transporter
MIGSGWLFSSYYAAKIAGPAAYVAWILTSGIILILGLCLSEIACNYPKRGLMARLLVISHNKEFAFVCTIATWLGLTAVIATEAEGSIQYLSSLSETIRPYVFDVGLQQLTHLGMLFTILMVIIFGLLNFWGIRMMSHSNVVLTIAKVCIPIITAISIIVASFHSANFSLAHNATTMPYGFSSIFLAMIGAGMVYSFNGFQNIVSFSSEAKNPKRDIPIAMALSVIITLLVYLTLQTAFIGSLSPDMLLNGWNKLNFTSPFVQITMMLNLNLISIILYVDAVASPSGTGLIYTGSTTRMLTGMSQDKQMSKFFNKMSKYNFSRRSLVATILLAIAFLLLFRSWASLVSFLSLFYVISYMSIPICLGKLRKHGVVGSFKVPLEKIISPLLFVFLSMLFIVSGYPYTTYVTCFVFISFVFYVFLQYSLHGGLWRIVRSAGLMLGHIIALSVLSVIGPTYFGGYNYIGHRYFFMLIFIVSLITYYISVLCFNNSPEQVKTSNDH